MSSKLQKGAIIDAVYFSTEKMLSVDHYNNVLKGKGCQGIRKRLNIMSVLWVTFPIDMGQHLSQSIELYNNNLRKKITLNIPFLITLTLVIISWTGSTILIHFDGLNKYLLHHFFSSKMLKSQRRVHSYETTK